VVSPRPVSGSPESRANALPRPDHCLVMGVLNVTPDSFSDGGRWVDRDHAVAHGVAMCTRGATYVDVGGESTRPGADRVDPGTESRRVVPVVRDLVGAGVRVSVDTTRAAVALAAVEAGASMINDVSGGLADPSMARAVAETAVPWVIMHWRGHSDHMHALATYEDVVGEVRAELVAQIDRAVLAGVDPSVLVVDPGLGFAKTAAHNWQLLRKLGVFAELGFPVLVGASRKRFLGELLATEGGTPRPADGREVATAAVSALAAAEGAWGVRVHEVEASLDAVAVAAAWHWGTSRAPGRVARRDRPA